jgi:hypothetical protein
LIHNVYSMDCIDWVKRFCTVLQNLLYQEGK